MTQSSLWSNCLTRLEQELSAQQFNTWIRPLQAVKEDHTLRLLAPNRFVMDWVKERFLTRIVELATQTDSSPQLNVSVEVGGEERTRVESKLPQPMQNAPKATPIIGRLNSEFTFQNHVEGKSNQRARAAARQVGENPGGNNNPLFIYGGVGLGKVQERSAPPLARLQRRGKAVRRCVPAGSFCKQCSCQQSPCWRLLSASITIQLADRRQSEGCTHKNLVIPATKIRSTRARMTRLTTSRLGTPSSPAFNSLS